MLTLLLLLACGPDMATVPDGTYALQLIENPEADTPEVEEFGALRLVVETAEEQLTVVLDDGSEDTVGLVLLDEDQWVADCHTMSSYVLTEAWSVETGSLSLGPVEVADPVLSAFCGAGPILWEERASGPDGGEVFQFTQATD